MCGPVGNSVCVTVEGALRFQKLKSGPVAHSFFLLPVDPDVKSSATLQHHVSLHAVMLSAMIIVD